MKPIELKIGSRGPDVAVLQEKRGLKADGIFGKDTLSAVLSSVAQHNAKAEFKSDKVRTDGVVDARVWSALGLSHWSRRVPVPVAPNVAARCARQSTMLSLFGAPAAKLTVKPTGITNVELIDRIVTKNVGPFSVTGLDAAVESLTRIFAGVLRDEPDIYVRLESAGMLCVRAVRGSTTNWSNHSWGTAIDIRIDGMLDVLGDGNCQYGLQFLRHYFNQHGWFWGAEFGREDSMHFEAGEALVRTWA